MAGKISRTEFGKRLAMEWASFPVLTVCKGAHRQLNRGQSYYAGDGLNKALVAPEKIEALLDKVKALLGVLPLGTPIPGAILARKACRASCGCACGEAEPTGGAVLSKLFPNRKGA